MKRRHFIQAMAAAAFSYAAIGSGALQAQPICSAVSLRRDYRALTNSQWSTFVAAMKRINRPLPGIPLPTVYDGFVQEYSVYQPTFLTCGFDKPSGLTRLRQFLLRFEQALQAVDPSVTLPYWNFPLDAEAPDASGVFSPAFMGGNGHGFDHDVVDGAFASWTVGYPGLLDVAPVRHTLSRQFAGGDRITPWDTPESVATVLQSPTIDALTGALMGAVAARVFTGIGGDMSTLFAPNDPLFWLVACYIDKLFDDWLQAHPEAPQPASVCYRYA